MRLVHFVAVSSTFANTFVVAGAFAPTAKAPGQKWNVCAIDCSARGLASSTSPLKKRVGEGSVLHMNDVPAIDDTNRERAHDLSEDELLYNDIPNIASSDATLFSEVDRDISFEQRRSEGAISTKDVSKDPIGYLLNEISVMDVNSVINTGIILLATVAILSTLVTVDAGMMRGWSAAEMAVRIPVDNWDSYSAVLKNSPVSTKAITSATVYTIGDVIAQRTEGVTIGELDRPRIVRSLLAGLIGHGPLSHIWYDRSEALFNDVLEWTEWWSVFPKVVLDQLTWGPFWNNMYIVLLGTMKLEKPAIIWEDMKRTTIPLLVSGLKLWPLAHCVTYGLIPLENRLLWVDFIEIIWVTILATQAAGGGTAADGHDSSTESSEDLDAATGKP